MCALAHVWRPEDMLRELVIFIYHDGPGACSENWDETGSYSFQFFIAFSSWTYEITYLWGKTKVSSH